MRLPFRVFLVAILLAMLTGNAEAANATLCAAYVKAAMKRIAINKSNSCGIKAIGFVDDEAGQRRWCKQSTDAAVLNESLWDDEITEKCQICGQYAMQANEAARQNRLFHCGLTGNRFGSGDGHMKWCMGLAEESGGGFVGDLAGFKDSGPKSLKKMYLDPETRARGDAIKTCKAQYTQAQIAACEKYATDAVALANMNASNSSCHGEGPRWTQNWDEHFAFCTWGWMHDINGKLVTTAMKEEGDARQAAVKACAHVVSLGKKKAGTGGSNGNQLQPQQSSGPSPFGDGKKIDAIAPGASGISTVNKPNSTTAPPSNTLRSKKVPAAAANSGGFDTSKSSNSSAMDRLGGLGVDSSLGNVSGNSGYVAPQGGRRKPCPTCGAKPSVESGGGINKAQSQASQRPARRPSRPAQSLPGSGSSGSIDYGGCAGCGQDRFTQPK